MKAGIILSTSDSEVMWNALRFANFTRLMGDEVRVFLIAGSVKWESLDTDTFKVSEQLQNFLESEGEIFICGTCLDIHQLKAPETFTVATLKELYDIVAGSDKIITF